MSATPTLLLDMDGPLADFDVHFYNRCEGRYGFNVAGPHERTARYFTDHIPNRRHRAEARKMIDDAGWFRDLPVTPGALEGVDGLLAAGIDVWVCTKPLEVNPTCRDDKGAWLRRYFPMLEHKLILAPDKSMIRGDILLDDAPHLKWLNRACWHPVVFTAPYNGAGSEWADMPHWQWGNSVESLVLGAVSPPSELTGGESCSEANV